MTQIDLDLIAATWQLIERAERALQRAWALSPPPLPDRLSPTLPGRPTLRIVRKPNQEDRGIKNGNRRTADELRCIARKAG